MKFEEWFKQLQELASKSGYSENAVKTFHPNDWRGYFHDGYSPSEALAEDSSYA